MRHLSLLACTLALVVLPLGQSPAAAAVWNVGWGFNKHGGFPALPPSWQSTTGLTMAGYFLGNASGLDNPAELEAENRFSVIGIGWQLDNIPSHYSHLEQFEVKEAKALKKLRPDAKVMILRNTEVGTVFWDKIKAKMYDPETQDFWTQCGGKPCKGSWGSPAGNTDKYWFNFSVPTLTKFWVEEFVMAPLRQHPDLFDGVYFDCSCGSPPGDSLNQNQMQADAQVAFDRALSEIKALGKWASAWNSQGQMQASTNSEACEKQMDDWLGFTSDPARAGLSLQIGAPAFYAPTHDPETLRVQNLTLAAFQVVQNARSVLELPVKGAYGLADGYAWGGVLDLSFGAPKGEGVKVGPGLYRREYEGFRVEVNCTDLAGSFVPPQSSKA